MQFAKQQTHSNFFSKAGNSHPAGAWQTLSKANELIEDLEKVISRLGSVDYFRECKVLQRITVFAPVFDHPKLDSEDRNTVIRLMGMGAVLNTKDGFHFDCTSKEGIEQIMGLNAEMWKLD